MAMQHSGAAGVERVKEPSDGTLARGLKQHYEKTIRLLGEIGVAMTGNYLHIRNMGSLLVKLKKNNGS